MQVLILAGGQGTRLKPFTNAIPKPLIPIGDMPILEVVLRQLKYRGAERVVLAVNHLAQLIEAFFGNGGKLGLDISYSLEDKPLGTAGPLRLIAPLDENFIVMNSDLFTTLDYADLFKSHKKSGAAATIATFKKKVKIDLGVLKVVDGRLDDYIEKPTYDFTVSMGIYALNRRVVDFIPAEGKFDMPELILKLHKAGERVDCYTGDFEWLDIGQVDDYEKALELFLANRSTYLPGENS
ncbi:nucleoside-diphosphate-sugar pyrophosphorylase [Rhizomicrobium sp. SCGC AG-212-E05]|nr:nucleoside-diphosphate-sugar pyrophosphorylase [Rhizomicrobium sp. SCGC AG-212-E05]